MDDPVCHGPILYGPVPLEAVLRSTELSEGTIIAASVLMVLRNLESGALSFTSTVKGSMAVAEAKRSMSL